MKSFVCVFSLLFSLAAGQGERMRSPRREYFHDCHAVEAQQRQRYSLRAYSPPLIDTIFDNTSEDVFSFLMSSYVKERNIQVKVQSCCIHTCTQVAYRYSARHKRNGNGVGDGSSIGAVSPIRLQQMHFRLKNIASSGTHAAISIHSMTVNVPNFIISVLFYNVTIWYNYRRRN